MADTIETPPAGPFETWAGIQVTQGSRRVPVLGALRSETTALTLAEVARDGDALLFVDRPCSIAVKSSHNVTLEFDPKGVAGMPPVTFRFVKDDAGRYVAGPWVGAWGHVDVDNDGVAGIHVRVDAGICAGYIDVASRTESTAIGDLDTQGLHGTIDVSIARDIVGASNPCLGLVDRHTVEQATGRFLWVPVATGSTCESLASGPWPARLP